MKGVSNFCAIILLVLTLAQAAILIPKANGIGVKTPKNRKLLFTLDREEEFKRRDDRVRCKLISPRRNESASEYTHAKAQHKHPNAEG